MRSYSNQQILDEVDRRLEAQELDSYTIQNLPYFEVELEDIGKDDFIRDLENRLKNNSKYRHNNPIEDNDEVLRLFTQDEIEKHLNEYGLTTVEMKDESQALIDLRDKFEDLMTKAKNGQLLFSTIAQRLDV